VTFLASIPAVFLLGPLLSDPRYVLGPGADTQVGLGAVFDMVNGLACIGTAVAVFSVVKRQHEGLALGFVTTRLLEAAIIAIGVVCLLGLVSLRSEGVAATDAGAAAVVGRCGSSTSSCAGSCRATIGERSSDEPGLVTDGSTTSTSSG
jgi:hypothetical protein